MQRFESVYNESNRNRQGNDLASKRIKEISLQEGYDAVGITHPGISREDSSSIKMFYESGSAAEMEWFGKHMDIRCAPETLMPGAKSVIVLASIYRSKSYDQFCKTATAKISRYSVGRDYHKVLHKKGENLLERIKFEFPGIEGRITVDTVPVPEKVFAVQAGIGFRGKNTNIIHPKLGSYFFISLLFLSLELEIDQPLKMNCAGCNLCVIRCPTGALDGVHIDPRRCISYRNIEKKSILTEEEIASCLPWLSGCDICQEVCPHNIHAAAAGHFTKLQDFLPGEEIFNYLKNPQLLDDSSWDMFTRGKAFRRTGKERWNMLVNAVTNKINIQKD